MTSWGKILVVDDVQDVGESVDAAADPLGMRWKAVSDLADLLRMLSPDTELILIDPSAAKMAGIDALNLLGKQKCNARIVLMSGNEQSIEAAEKLAVEYGLSVAGNLRKPFQPTELRHLLEQCATRQTPAERSWDPGIDVDEEELRHAIRCDEFVLHYQPQIEVRTGKVIGLEAFARWKNPHTGLTFPDSFMGGLRFFGLLNEFDSLVVKHGLSESKQLAKENSAKQRLTLKLSNASVCDPSFPERFVSLVKKHNAPMERLVIEISLRDANDRMRTVRDVMTRLCRNGALIAVDDYGLGSARIQDLRDVWASELKINRTFVQNMFESDRDRIMVEKLILIAHEMNMGVLAEGVETQQQLELLRRKECDYAQGYLFSHPLPVEKMTAWLKNYRQEVFAAA